MFPTHPSPRQEPCEKRGRASTCHLGQSGPHHAGRAPSLVRAAGVSGPAASSGGGARAQPRCVPSRPSPPPSLSRRRCAAVAAPRRRAPARRTSVSRRRTCARAPHGHERALAAAEERSAQQAVRVREAAASVAARHWRSCTTNGGWRTNSRSSCSPLRAKCSRTRSPVRSAATVSVSTDASTRS